MHVKPLGAECSEAGLDLKRKAVDVLLLMQTLRHENLNPFIGESVGEINVRVIIYLES